MYESFIHYSEEFSHILISNITYQFVGALWYLISIEREDRCWRDATPSGERVALYCEDKSEINYDLVRLLNTSCPFTNPDDITDPKVFNFGIFIDALESGVVETWDFPEKFFYCFWWGLRNLRFVTNTITLYPSSF